MVDIRWDYAACLCLSRRQSALDMHAVLHADTNETMSMYKAGSSSTVCYCIGDRSIVLYEGNYVNFKRAILLQHLLFCVFRISKG